MQPLRSSPGPYSTDHVDDACERKKLEIWTGNSCKSSESRDLEKQLGRYLAGAAKGERMRFIGLQYGLSSGPRRLAQRIGI